MGRRSRQPQAKPGLLDELKELRKFRESLPASANDVQATVGDDSGSEEQVTRAEERLQEILTTTLDEFAEAQKLERQRLKQVRQCTDVHMHAFSSCGKLCCG
jgi:ElaB/YqjD/DUF883 family membrane-anchored ribosome-binding protein